MLLQIKKRNTQKKFSFVCFYKSIVKDLFFLVSILLFISLTTSCSAIVKSIYGIHQPRVVNEKKIKSFMIKNNIDTTNCFGIIDKDFIFITKSIKMTYPEIMVFDRFGRFIKYKEDVRCNGNAFKFIDSLNLVREYSAIDTINVKMFEQKMSNLNGNTPIHFQDDSSDFFVLIFWTEWTGKLNKNHTFIWEEKAKKNKNAIIKVVKVNCDFQEYWDKNIREENIKALTTPLN